MVVAVNLSTDSTFISGAMTLSTSTLVGSVWNGRFLKSTGRFHFRDVTREIPYR